MKSQFNVVLALAALLVSGCTTTSAIAPAQEAKTAAATEEEPAGEAPSGPASAAEEAACREAIAKTTGESQMAVIRSEATPSSTEIIVGVGAEKARWQCMMAGGKVAGVMEASEEVVF